MEYMIEVEELSKTFGSETVLEPLTWKWEKGKIHGLVGRNGSGKTVLMKMICGVLLPTNGTVWVNGRQVGKEVDFPEDIGLILETPGFIPYLNGRRNLQNLADIRKRIMKEDIRSSMELVGLDYGSKKKVGKYSLGMRQRLGIAQAVMEDPALLVLDEPFNGLDIKGVGEIRELLLEWKKQGKTMLISSHHHEDIDYLCDSVLEMDHGRVDGMMQP